MNQSLEHSAPVAHDSESDDDFDDFNEYVENDQSEVVYDQESSAHDEAGPAVDTTPDRTFINNIINFDTRTTQDLGEFQSKLDDLLNELFPLSSSSAADSESLQLPPLLSQRSESMYQNISELPRLKPPNWIKLKIRRSLLIKLGVPVNLDEVLDTSKNDLIQAGSSSNSQLGGAQSRALAHAQSLSLSQSLALTLALGLFLQKPLPRHRRSSLVSELDINWHGFTIPKFEDLHVNSEQEHILLNDTSAQLAKIEIENLDHSSIEKLRTSSDEDLDLLLTKYEANHAKLIELSSVWQNQLHELKKDYDIFESVVQNLVGHTQRLKREEIMANLNKVKLSKKKSHRVK